MDGLLDEIADAGPGGSFFESPHTLRHLRTGYHTSRIFPHYGLEKWQELGRPTAEAAAARGNGGSDGDGARAGRPCGRAGARRGLVPHKPRG